MWITYATKHNDIKDIETDGLLISGENLSIIATDGHVYTCRPTFVSIQMGGIMRENGHFSLIRRMLIGFFGWIQAKLA